MSTNNNKRMEKNMNSPSLQQASFSAQSTKRRFTLTRMSLLGATAALLAALSAQGASAAAVVRVPDQAPGIPAYTRILPGDTWSAVVFYRDPGCIPADFNLLQFFDIPRAFGCPLTVEGVEVWENGPGLEPAPKLAVTHADGPVPIWFVRTDELGPAVADRSLTISELESLSSVVTGSTHQYQEMLRPDEMIVIQARGTLSDGRSFSLHAVCCNAGLVRIEFR